MLWIRGSHSGKCMTPRYTAHIPRSLCTDQSRNKQTTGDVIAFSSIITLFMYFCKLRCIPHPCGRRGAKPVFRATDKQLSDRIPCWRRTPLLLRVIAVWRGIHWFVGTVPNGCAATLCPTTQCGACRLRRGSSAAFGNLVRAPFFGERLCATP